MFSLLFWVLFSRIFHLIYFLKCFSLKISEISFEFKSDTDIVQVRVRKSCCETLFAIIKQKLTNLSKKMTFSEKDICILCNKSALISCDNCGAKFCGRNHEILHRHDQSEEGSTKKTCYPIKIQEADGVGRSVQQTPLNVITFGQTKSDNINEYFYSVIFSK